MSAPDPRNRSRSAKAMRGQPLLVLVLVLVGWSALRATTWTPPVPLTGEADVIAASAVPSSSVQAPTYSLTGALTVGEAEPERRAEDLPAAFADPSDWQPAPLPPMLEQPLPAPQTVQQRAKPDAPAERRVPPRRAAGHALLQAAGYARLQVPPQLAAYFTQASLPAPASRAERPAQASARLAEPARAPQQARRTSRWSGDGWLLWRDDTTTAITSGRPSYGRSQMGAVVRYELAPGAGQRPHAYLRGSGALQGARENSAAAGLSLRPLAGLPLRLAGELRLNQRASGTEVAPAGYAVSELPPQQLPGSVVAEAYVQAGYVGGNVSTAFVDGQARVDRSLAASDDFDLRAGGAVWGGAQDDGARLDVGPSASLGFRLGSARGRLAADYRVRVAGNAEPASGPALTLSAGF